MVFDVSVFGTDFICVISGLFVVHGKLKILNLDILFLLPVWDMQSVCYGVRCSEV